LTGKFALKIEYQQGFRAALSDANVFGTQGQPIRIDSTYIELS
jgi:hypothetical protein